MMILKIIFLINFSIILINARDSQNKRDINCPEKCNCLKQETVRCMFQKLKYVPKVLSSTKVL